MTGAAPRADCTATPRGSPSPSSTRHYEALDGLRGFAVLLVFCVHAAGNAAGVLFGMETGPSAMQATSGWDEQLLFWLHRSHHGVYIFFVLSGFLIGRMWWPRPALTYRAFAWRRTLRIYPAFLLSFVAALAFAFASQTWTPPDFPRVIGNFLFLNGVPTLAVVPFNIVTWSLFYEMTFYIGFPVLALLALRGDAKRAWWLPAAGIIVPAVTTMLGAHTFYLCWSLLFCGVAAAMYHDRVAALARALPGVGIVVVYLVVTTVALLDIVAPTVAILAFGAVAVLVLVKGLQAGNIVAWLLTRAPLIALGRISYSFYLLHWMIVVLVARAITPYADALGPVGGTIVIFVAGFVLSALAAAVSWWLAERPYFARRHRARARA